MLDLIFIKYLAADKPVRTTIALHHKSKRVPYLIKTGSKPENLMTDSTDTSIFNTRAQEILLNKFTVNFSFVTGDKLWRQAVISNTACNKLTKQLQYHPLYKYNACNSFY